VEGHPETDRPLDPEPGLGGIFSLGLLGGKASPFFEKFPNRDRYHRPPSKVPRPR
jgi:hypothetical protein